jgi:hypothetical protein
MRIPLRNRKIWSLGRGKANQVTQAIMELYFLRPKHVTVYGVDFYTSPEAPYAQQSKGSDWMTEVFLEKSSTRLWRYHNQLHQKQIAAEIQRRRKFFAGDDRYKELIGTPDDEFLKYFSGWKTD